MKNEIDTRIAALLAAHAATPFQWGVHDCCQFARIVARSLSGRDMATRPYSSEFGALRVLARLGGFDGLMAAYGATALPSSAMAQRGDVVLVAMPQNLFGGALAICTGAAAHTAGAAGLVAVPMERWIKAWSLPCLR